MKDVCLDNDNTEPVPTPSSRYIVRVDDPVTGFIVSENTVENEEMARNEPMIGLATVTASVAGLVVRDNILPSFTNAHDLPPWRHAGRYRYDARCSCL